MYGLPTNSDRNYIANLASSIKVPEFVPKSGVRIAVTDSEANDNNATGIIFYLYKFEISYYCPYGVFDLKLFV